MPLKRFSKHVLQLFLVHPSKIDPVYPTVPPKAFKSAENLQIYQKYAYNCFLVKPGWFIWFFGLTTHLKVLFNAFQNMFCNYFLAHPSKIDPVYPTVPQKAFKSAENLQIYQKYAYNGFGVKPGWFI